MEELVFCGKCGFRKYSNGDIPAHICMKEERIEITPIGKETHLVLCIEKNENNDCKDFEEGKYKKTFCQKLFGW